MTRRGFWFLAASAGTLILSLALPYQFSLSLLGLTGLAWCGIEWALFRLRADVVVRRLEVERTINGQSAGRGVLWENRPTRIEVRIATSHWLGLPFIRALDLRPQASDSRGAWSCEGPCRRNAPLEIHYELIPKLPGKMVFDGVLIELTDGPGFFATTLCVRQRIEVAILPSLTPERGLKTQRKRDNRIPAHGVHRHLRPGSGTELLNLRDYIVGDPPKRIAWKTSARRDRLITKEYESEVPVRTWLFLDSSDSVRVGWPGPTALDQSVRIASALTRELIAQRDPVGLVIVEDERATVLSPAPGPRQQTRILGELCRTAGRPPKASPCPPGLLYGALEQVCKSRYPDLLDPRINRRMVRVEWPWSRILGWPLGLLLVLSIVVIATSRIWSRSSIPYAVVGLVALCAAMLVWMWFQFRTWRRGKRSSAGVLRRRKTLSSAIAAIGGLGPVGLAKLIESDADFSRHAQQVLIDHGMPYSRPLHDAKGNYLFRSPGKIEAAARALLAAVAHGRDNEVFALFIDLLEHEDHWQPLIEAMKVARSRHHQVVLVCPWPAELMPPAGRERSRHDRSLSATFEATDLHVERLLSERYFRAFDSASHHLAAVGIPIVPATLRSTPDEILRRIELVRSARILAR